MWWIVGLTAGALLARWGAGMWSWNLEDPAVYRRAGADVLHGRSVFAPTSGLPFTYPPFAACLFLPIHAAGPLVAALMLTALSLVALWCLVTTSVTQLSLPSRLVGPACAAGLAAEPVLRTLRLGQINLLLAGLIIADCFIVRPKFRGLLTGIAAGTKLVPGVFVFYFALRREWAAAARSGAGLLATIGIGFAGAPGDSWKYWTRLFYRPDHIGGVAYVDNQSLFGVLVRLTHREHPPVGSAVVVELGALALALVAARRQLRSGADLAALTCLGLGGALASPISWSHHWVWCIAAALVLLAAQRYRAAGLLAAVFYLAPHWFTPSGGLREFHETWWQFGLCALMPLAGVLFLLTMARASPAAGSRSDAGHAVADDPA